MQVRVGIFLVVLSATLFLRAAVAQETIFSVPNGDILDRGRAYAEVDVTYQSSTGIAGYTPRFVVGAGKRVELGVNLSGLSTPGDQHTILTPTMKWKAYDGQGNGWAFLVGDELFVPLQERSYQAGNYLYGEFAKTWKSRTRATAGLYYFTPNVVARGQRVGGQFGIEQPVGKRLILATDWFTGDQALGYLTPGAILKLTSKLTWYLGYQIGNSNVSHGNQQLLTEVGWNF